MSWGGGGDIGGNNVGARADIRARRYRRGADTRAPISEGGGGGDIGARADIRADILRRDIGVSVYRLQREMETRNAGTMMSWTPAELHGRPALALPTRAASVTASRRIFKSTSESVDGRQQGVRAGRWRRAGPRWRRLDLRAWRPALRTRRPGSVGHLGVDLQRRDPSVALLAMDGQRALQRGDAASVRGHPSVVARAAAVARGAMSGASALLSGVAVRSLDTPLEVDTKIANALLGLATEAFAAAQLASRDASITALQGAKADATLLASYATNAALSASETTLQSALDAILAELAALQLSGSGGVVNAPAWAGFTTWELVRGSNVVRNLHLEAPLSAALANGDDTLAGKTTEVEADTTASALLLKHKFLDGGADDVTLATLGEVLLEPTLTTLGNFPASR